MSYRSSFAFGILSVASVGVVVACESTSNEGNLPINGVGQLDASFDASGYDGSTPGNPENPGDPSDAGGTDAGPSVRDRFRHQWPVTADQPQSSSYTVDSATGVVTDKVTGLQWMRDLLTQEQSSYDGGGGDGLVAVGSQVDARGLCSNATVGGLTGWRLPTMVEMLTIISFDSNDWNNSAVFTDTSYGAEYFVDSNTPDLFLTYDNHYHPWRFNGGSGFASVRCVRSPYAVAATPQDPPAGRYVVKTDTVIDTVTKLEWELATSTDLHLYSAATEYCDGLAGGSWRVPSLKELATIWSEGAGGLEPTVFGPVSANGYVWSSTLYWGTQSIPYANKNLRLEWSPGGTKFFSWGADYDLSYTKCVRDVP